MHCPKTIHAVVDAIKNHTLDLQQWSDAYAKTLPPASQKAWTQALALMQWVDDSYQTPAGTSCQTQAVGMMALLHCLHIDTPTLIAAMLYNAVQYADLTLDVVQDHSHTEVVRLIQGVQTMEALHHMHQRGAAHNTCQSASDTLRRMMLAMVNDVRIVMIKLTEHICVLRHLKHVDTTQQQTIARETMDIYAPLANRLGIAQLKWQLEDMAFRFLQPQAYQAISQGLHAKRQAREAFVATMVAHVQQMLDDAGVAYVSCRGRAKHIYSIYNKMQKKSVTLDHIYDTIALRIILHHQHDCYDVLSLVHARWASIPEEFDDYITQPKPNGYQSIHTAIVGPESRPVEIQIRSQAMHDAAEFGVASHWLYKEGQAFATYKNKVAWLNQLTTLQQDRDEVHVPSDFERHTVNLFQDRVFVFTPNGEVKDLPKGATPLDFAYAIHTQIGHRCKGAKINGKIATLKTPLHNADRVEILTQKHPNPSQDWLKENSGYLKTARARSKVSQWFRHLHHDTYVEQGRQAFDKAARRMGLQHNISPQACAKDLGLQDVQALYLAIGQGEKNAQAVLEKWQHAQHTTTALPEWPDNQTQGRIRQDQSIQPVEAIGCEGMKMTLAHCCHPLPDDAIVGWISRSRGVVVHRQSCALLQTKHHEDPKRFVAVAWHLHPNDRFLVALQCLTADFNHTSLALSQWLNHEKAALFRLSSSQKKSQQTLMNIEVFLQDKAHLLRLLAMLKQLKSVDDAWRVV